MDTSEKMAALGDPRRQEILDLLATGPRSVAELARQLPVTRPAVSQHLKVLLDAGLVTQQSIGTRNIYRLDPAGLEELRDHLDAMWQKALSAFKESAEQPPPAATKEQKMTNTDTQSLVVRKSVLVEAPQAKAFDVFTEGHATWWPMATHHIGKVAPTTVILEPHVGGRWYERAEDGAECAWGKVLVWDRPARLVLAWQLGENWQSDPAKTSEVEVRFLPETSVTTRVELEHRLIEQHGKEAETIRGAVDSQNGWSGL